MPDLSLRPASCLLCGCADATLVAVTPPHLAPDRGERFRFVRCRECRLVYLSPRPTPEALEDYYGPGYLPHRGAEAWGRWAPVVRWARRGQDRRRTAVAVGALRRVRAAPRTEGESGSDRAGPSPADPHAAARSGEPGGDGTGSDGLLRALDVGCGVPTFLAQLRERTGARCTGIDTDDRGWRDRPEAVRELDLRMGALDDLDLEPGYDLITLWHVLEHVRAPRPFLSRLRTLAAPDAALVVEVPDHASPVRRLQEASWIGYDAPRHAAAYEPGTLRAILEAEGWRVLSLERSGTLDPWVLWWLGRQVQEGRTLEGSLENLFPGFVAGKLLSLPLTALQRWLPLGAMTAVARPA